jgi:hypothetical protein
MNATKQFFTYILVCVSLLLGAASVSWAADVSTPDDAAKFLAGVQPSANSPLASLTHTSSWQRHAMRFDSAWKNLDQRQLSRIRAWSKENLREPKPSNVFYMFSGPDFLYADAFFPDASVYVLSGLEPVGSVPELTGLSPRSISTGLANIETSLGSVLNHSFFITKEMRGRLHASRFTGALPILYVFLERSGKVIRETSLVRLDAEGGLQPSGDAQSPGGAEGVKIVFSNRDGREQTLYYFSTNLANDGVKKSGFLKFCDKLGVGYGFVKSASYLLHGDEFSTVRQFLLDHTTAMVQDDSGIPVKFFDQEAWDLHPFGRYTAPIRIFSRYSQARLREAFHRGHATPLNFGVGYKWRPHESNLLLATKKAAGKTAGR